MSALQAVFNLLHLALPFFGKPLCGGHPAEEKGHSCALVDDDAGGTWQAVAAGAAEVTGQFLPLLLDKGCHLGGHLRSIVHVGEPFLQLGFSLDSPDGKDIVKLGHERHGGVGVGDEAAGQTLHGDEAHVLLLTDPDQLDILLIAQIAERKLHRLIQAGLCRLQGHVPAVGGDADMADLSLCFRLQHAVIEPGIIAGTIAPFRLVQLIEVQAVRLEISQGGLQVLPELFRGSCVRLRGDEYLVPHAGKGRAQLLLAVRIISGGIVETHAALISPVKNLHRPFLIHPLQGENAEGILNRADTGTS